MVSAKMTTATVRIDFPRPAPVSPWWHTGLLAGIFLWLAVSGAFFQRQASAPGEFMQPQHRQVLPVYLSIIAMQWVLFAAVWKGGLARTGTRLVELIGGSWTRARDVLGDGGIALSLWVVLALFRMMWGHLSGPGETAAPMQALMPRSAAEILLWVGVSLSAGFCEELVFRGYFQRQFEVLAGSRWIALALQAVLFGVSHGYQGIEACVKITVIGALFGLLAIWRRSLRPGMIAHAMSDILGGIGI